MRTWVTGVLGGVDDSAVAINLGTNHLNFYGEDYTRCKPTVR